MLQELLRIPLPQFLQDWLGRPYLPVYGYGLMLVLGFLAAAQIMKVLARRTGFDPDAFVTASLIGLITGVIGGRLSHIVENWSHFTRPDLTASQNFKNMLDVSGGGLTFFGGFLFATPCVILYGLKKKIPILKGMDIVAPSLMVGLAFGRLGCYLNGCCHGELCEWGVKFPYASNAYVQQFEDGQLQPKDPRLLTYTEDGRPRLLTKEEAKRIGLAESAAHEHALPVHPTQLYSAFNAFFLTAVLLAFFTLRPSPGRVFALMLILKGASRFTLETIRTEPVVLGRSLSYSMVIAIGLVIAGILMWFLCGAIDKNKEGRRRLAVAPAA